MLIPFASGRSPNIHTDSSGAPRDVAAIGFGSATNAITIDANGQVEPLSDSLTTFTLPFDAVLDSVYLTLESSINFAFPSGTVTFPYVQIYAAAPDSVLFTPIPGAAAIPTDGYSGTVPAYTLRTAAQTGIGATLPAGTRILIGGLMSVAGGGNLTSSYYFYFTGGIALRAA
jgi:hypothetical protein